MSSALRRVNLPWYFVFHNVTDCCCCSLCTSTYTRRGARRVRFSWSPGPSPRQPTVVWPRRDAPAANCASGAKQRRDTAVPPSNSSIVLLLLAVVDNTLNLREYAIFRLKSDGPSRRILGPNLMTSAIGFSNRKNLARFAYSDCIRPTILGDF